MPSPSLGFGHCRVRLRHFSNSSAIFAACSGVGGGPFGPSTGRKSPLSLITPFRRPPLKGGRGVDSWVKGIGLRGLDVGLASCLPFCLSVWDFCARYSALTIPPFLPFSAHVSRLFSSRIILRL
jgi:hypothetical protein